MILGIRNPAPGEMERCQVFHWHMRLTGYLSSGREDWWRKDQARLSRRYPTLERPNMPTRRTRLKVESSPWL